MSYQVVNFLASFEDWTGLGWRLPAAPGAMEPDMACHSRCREKQPPKRDEKGNE